jgi:1-acyl-sn-glycerol-3-phosphate acyltransferase
VFIIAAIRSALTYVAVSLYILIISPPAMLVALLFPVTGHLYVLGRICVRLGMALSGIRYRVAGSEQLPLERAAVYCANHQSNIDPPILFAALHPRMHILYKSEINAIPLLGRVLRFGGFIPVDRRNKEAAMRSIEAGAASLREGNSFLIFPEGTRSQTAEMLPFKKGGFLMAIKAGVPIVPVAVQGGRDAMRRGGKLVRPALVSIRVGAPIDTAGPGAQRRDALIATVRDRITALLAEGPIADA